MYRLCGHDSDSKYVYHLCGRDSDMCKCFHADQTEVMDVQDNFIVHIATAHRLPAAVQNP